MKRRPGITLIEVLVAIFIMAIGLLALLTLFPLGALRMAQSLQDDRAAACATDAANICDAFGLRNDSALAGKLSTTAPVYIDPYGAVFSTTLGMAPGGVIQRVAPQNIPAPYSGNASAARYFTLLDDMTFVTNGLPDTSSGVIPRGDRYTWALMLHQLTASSVPSTSLTVVVYAGRSTAVQSGETTYAASGNPQDTSVTLNFTGTPPTIRRGTWILDTSSDSSGVHGDFYRVVGVTPVSATQDNLELQTPISNANGITAVTVLDNVVEVFEREAYPSNEWAFRTNP